METALRLLMRDGAVQVIFYPLLTPEQYAELFHATEQATTRAELRKAVKALGKRWGSRVEIDEL
jgi:hypothetical protein